MKTAYQRIREMVPQGRFVRNILIMAGGAASAQAIIAVSSPIVTRLYTPEDFGVLAVYASVLGVLSGVLALRYDFAIPLPESDETSADLFCLSLVTVCLFVTLSSAVVWLAGGAMARGIGMAAFVPYLWLIPVGIGGVGFYSVLTYWAVRAESYKTISQTKLSQSIGMAGTQVGMGLLGFGPLGLITGQIVGQSAGVGSLFRVVRRLRGAFRNVSVANSLRAASRYYRFPLFSGTGTLLNSAGVFLPSLLVVILYGSQVGGWFALTERIVRMPMRLVGKATAQVYLGEAAQLARRRPRQLRRLFAQTARKLFLIGTVLALGLVFLGPWAFAFVFGDAWSEAGRYAQVLSLMLLAQFVVSPLSQTLNILERQGVQMLWDLGRLVFVAAAFGAAHWLSWSPLLCIGVYGVLMSVAYAVLLYASWRAVRGKARGDAPDFEEPPASEKERASRTPDL